MIHLNDESLNDIRLKLQAGMERWNAARHASAKMSIEPPCVRHVSPEKQAIYVAVHLSTVNLPSLTETDENGPTMALKDQLMAMIVQDHSVGGWLSSFFTPSDIVELNVIHSEIRVSNDTSTVIAKLVRPGAFSLLTSTGSPVTAREYIGPMGLKLDYDVEKNRFNFTLTADSSQQLLNDPYIDNPSVEVAVNFSVCLRLTLRPEMEAEYLRRIIMLQQEQIQNLASPRTHGYGSASQSRFRLGGARTFQRSRAFQSQSVEDLSMWLAIAMKESMGRSEAYRSTQDCVEARALERFGQSPIRHTSRAGEEYGFQRAYAMETSGAQLVGDPQRKAADEASVETPSVQPE